MTFVVFGCFATTRVNMRFRAENTRDSAQASIQCRKCIGSPVVRTDGRTDVRTDGHVTTSGASALARQRSSIAKEIWYSIKPKNFGSDVVVT